MQTQNYIIDGVILETSGRVPDSWSSDAANVKRNLKSVTVWYSAERLYDEATPFDLVISRLPSSLKIPSWTFFNSHFRVDFKNIIFSCDEQPKK